MSVKEKRAEKKKEPQGGSLVFKHAHDGVGDIHDLKIMDLTEFGVMSGGEIEIADLFAQDKAIDYGIAQCNVQRAGNGLFKNRAGDDPAAFVEEVVADNDNGMGYAVYFEQIALFCNGHLPHLASNRSVDRQFLGKV